MKRLLLFIYVALLTVAANAQTSALATLSHNGEITTYYSSKALLEAHKAAQDSDVITLSGGLFEPATITKNVTIRGAGMAGNDPTIISGTLYVKPATKDGFVTLEGLFVTESIYTEKADNLHLVKCKMSKYSTGYGSNASQSLNIIQCEMLSGYHNYGDGAVITNSYIQDTSSAYIRNATIENSIINSYIGYIDNSYLINCIITDTNSKATTLLPKNSIATNCYYIGKATDPFKNVPNRTNKSFAEGTQFLKEGSTVYELLDELQTTWLGSDGTQVGMHGGNLPFDPETTTPKIKKFEVSQKTSADGKLSINLEIDAD